MILFGPGPMGVADDYENIIHCYPYTAGEYCMATDYRGEVNTFFREFEITVAQCVREFGEQNCSDYVKENWKNNNLEAAVTIVHAIEPRDDRDDAMLDNLNMPWRSAYFEWSTNGKDTKRVNDELLSEGGYRQFPIMAPRWDVESCGDVYGSSPAMDAAFDTKSLQHKTLREGQAIDHQTRPALQGPAALKGREIEGFPGGFTAVDGQGSTPPIQPMWQVGLRLDDMHISMQGTRDRIEAALFKPLFLMIANSSDTTQRTAAEIAAREQEKLIVLGPAVENVNGNLKALVNLTFAQMAAVGALPPAPPELQGQELGVEFISVLAQASKLIRVRPVNEWVQDVLQVGATKPEALDRLNVDEWVEGTADMRGVPPKMVVPLEEARKVREARANAQAAKEQAALVQAHAKTARDLAAAPTDQANALTSAGAGAGIGGL